MTQERFRIVAECREEMKRVFGRHTPTDAEIDEILQVALCRHRAGQITQFRPSTLERYATLLARDRGVH